MKELGPRGKNHHNYKRVKIRCEYCGEIKEKEYKFFKKSSHHFCSQRCYINWEQNFRSGKNNPSYSKLKTICDYCDKKIEVKKCHMKKYKYHFCNSKCFGKWKSENWSREKSVFWRGGISFEPYGIEFNKKLKETIRKRDNFTCQVCGKLEKDKAHTTHHIDYNKQNNHPTNLLLLCVSCHTRTNYNRHYWKDYFSPTPTFSRATVDLDTKDKKAIEHSIKTLKAFGFTEDIEVKQSSQKGFHIIAWTKEGVPKYRLLLARRLAGDDFRRIILDSKSKRIINVLFDHKTKKVIEIGDKA